MSEGQETTADDLAAALEAMREGRCRVPFVPSGVTCGHPLPCPSHPARETTASDRDGAP
jgi:hypothetical protein